MTHTMTTIQFYALGGILLSFAGIALGLTAFVIADAIEEWRKHCGH